MNDLPKHFDAAHKVANFPSIRPSVPERTLGERRRFRTIWISDVHLGTKGCNHELLIDFLDHTDSETMYLVGDIIDGWRLKKKFYWPAEHNDIVWRILKRAKRGTRIVYIPGNHDEMIRPFAGMNFGGVEIMRAAFHETADGRRLMVLHGDEFDTIMLAHRWLAFIGDAAYHLRLSQGAVLARGMQTVTLANTPDFATAFVSCEMAGQADFSGHGFTGTATGKRFDVSSNAVVQSGGTVLPGDIAGTTQSGGLYF